MLELLDELVYILDGYKIVFNKFKENKEGYNSNN